MIDAHVDAALGRDAKVDVGAVLLGDLVGDLHFLCRLSFELGRGRLADLDRPLLQRAPGMHLVDFERPAGADPDMPDGGPEERVELEEVLAEDIDQVRSATARRAEWWGQMSPGDR